MKKNLPFVVVVAALLVAIIAPQAQAQGRGRDNSRRPTEFEIGIANTRRTVLAPIRDLSRQMGWGPAYRQPRPSYGFGGYGYEPRGYRAPSYGYGGYGSRWDHPSTGGLVAVGAGLTALAVVEAVKHRRPTARVIEAPAPQDGTDSGVQVVVVNKSGTRIYIGDPDSGNGCFVPAGGIITVPAGQAIVAWKKTDQGGMGQAAVVWPSETTAVVR